MYRKGGKNQWELEGKGLRNEAKQDIKERAMTYMPIDEFGGNVRLRVLVLDGVISFMLVIAQCLCDIVEGGGIDIIKVVGEENCILHRVYRAGTTAWKKLMKKKNERRKVAG